MEALLEGQIRVHLKNGTHYDCPSANKSNVNRCITDLARIEHYKPPKAAPLPKATNPEVKVTVVTPQAPKKRKKRKKKSGSV